MRKTIIIFICIISASFILLSAGCGKQLLLLSKNTYLSDDFLKKPRKVEVKDKSGKSATLESMSFEYYKRYDFRFSYPMSNEHTFYVIKKPIELSIPFNAVSTVKFKGNNCLIEYDFFGKHHTAEGQFVHDANYLGKTSYGDYKIETNKVDEITFIDPPVTITLPKMEVLITLNDGSTIEATDIKAIDLFTGEGFSIYIDWAPIETFVHEIPVFIFQRGASEASISFSDIESAEFDLKAKSLKVTMKTKEIVEGTYIPYDIGQEKTIDGITGVCVYGGFFIRINYITRIDFGGKK